MAIAARPQQSQRPRLLQALMDAWSQQQVRHIWTNVAVFNLNLWVQTLVECWAWHKPAEEIRDRNDSPWDNPDRRPSQADRRKALRRQTPQNEYSSLSATHRRSSKIRYLYECLLQLAM